MTGRLCDTARTMAASVLIRGLESYFEGSRRRRPSGALGFKHIGASLFQNTIAVESSQLPIAVTLSASLVHSTFVLSSLTTHLSARSGETSVESSTTRLPSWFFGRKLDHGLAKTITARNVHDVDRGFLDHRPVRIAQMYADETRPDSILRTSRLAKVESGQR